MHVGIKQYIVHSQVLERMKDKLWKKTVIKIKNSVGRLNVRVGTAKRNINELESELRKLAIKKIIITIKRPTLTDHRPYASHWNFVMVTFFHPYRYSLSKATQHPGGWDNRCNSFSLI